MTGTMSTSLVFGIDGSCTLSAAQIGQKAWGVNRMRGLGLRVPPAMVITTDACEAYFRAGKVFPEGLWEAVESQVRKLAAEAGQNFGGGPLPLLLSVRSGAPHSMPGMMDTVLNLGMNAEVARVLADRDGHDGHAQDTLARFRRQYTRVVLRGVAGDIPEDPWRQLRAAISAVFDSWHSPRANAYRAHHGLSNRGGTGVLIQAMVFGNRDERSGTGVMFSRSPITGEPPAWGEWLPGGQGEDVVAGERTPAGLDALRAAMPAVHDELLRAAQRIEDDAGDIQDIEFTVEAGTLWLLQCRTAKRSASAAMRAAVAFAEAGRISREEALRRIGNVPARRRHPLELAPGVSGQPPLLVGTPASPGVASGIVELDPRAAQVRAAAGEAVVLARPTTSPDDIHGVLSAQGLLTEHGGATSHAAVVSRELGCPCVVACGEGSLASLGGQYVTLDGSTGRVWIGNHTIQSGGPAADSAETTLLAWGAAWLGMDFVSAADAPADVLNLDAAGGDWRRHLTAGKVVAGRVMESEEGVLAALAAGVKAVVSEDAMAALLICLRRRFRPARPAANSTSWASPTVACGPLALLQLLALKGVGIEGALEEALDMDKDNVRRAYAPLVEQGLCVIERATFRLTPAGRAHLGELLAGERRTVSQAAAQTLLGEFRVVNADLKRIVTDWQLKDGVTNDHLDAAYDADVLRRLRSLHARAEPLLQRLADGSPRLLGYAERLRRALSRIEEGEVGCLTKLTRDSYHMVWHELHREIMALADVDVSSEALAGYAD